MPLHEFRGYYDYRQHLEQNYPPNAWLTPSELFRPYFGYALALHIERQFRLHSRKGASTPLRIVEVGPGRGGLAFSILDYFRQFARDLFRIIRYDAV